MNTVEPDREVDFVSASKLRRFAEGVFVAAGMTRDDAAILADAVVFADLRGIPQQGAVQKIPQCLGRLKQGGTRAAAELITVRTTDCVTVLDAQHGWGQVAATRAMQVAVASARSAGVGTAVVRNTTYAGVLGYHPMTAIREGMIGLAINDSYPLQAPWGGSTTVLGNQAFAIGCPAGRNLPLLFDASTTAISLARIHEYRERGEMLPSDVALDSTGRPTTDPRAAMTGSLLPIGGPNGSGLAFMWEVLTGVLSGGGQFSSDLTPPADFPTPMNVSVFVMAIDPTIAMPRAQFLERVDALIDCLHDSQPSSGVERVFAPGERGFLMAEARERDGIPLPTSGVSALRDIGEELHVPW